MAFHHRIKPHHHASIWAVAAMAFAVSSLTYVNALDTYAAEGERSGPSQKTRDFFGAGGEGVNEPPAICLAERRAAEKEEQDRSGDTNNIEGLGFQIAGLQSQLDGMFPDDPRRADLQAQIDAKKAKKTQLEAEAAANPQKETTSGPSRDCKKAMIAQHRKEKQSFTRVIDDKIMPTFVRVEATVNKIKARIPDLEAAGASAEALAAIESDLKAIEADIVIIKNFMQKEKELAKQLPAEDIDPEEGYKRLEKLHQNESAGNAAARAADDLVSKFEHMLSVVEKL